MLDLTRRTLLGGLLATGAIPAARAGEWPEKPVVWVIPAGPGGPFDAFARPVGAHVTEKLGQSMIIDNRSGAGGTIGAASVARAPADGYTILVAATSTTYAPSVYPNAGFDLARDFVPICALARIQPALVVNPARLDVSTLQQFIEAAKQKPDSIEIGTPGVGTVPHLATLLLQSRAGIQLHHVPYRNTGQMMQDLLGGQIAANWSTVGLANAHVKSGKLRVLGIAGRRREPMMPDVPTLDEAGLKDFRAAAWFALFAPKATPVAIVDRLHVAVQEALAADDVKAVWAEQGAKVELESRAEFTRFVDQEIVRWTGIAKNADIHLE